MGNFISTRRTSPSPRLRCNGCRSETGLVAVTAEIFRRLLNSDPSFSGPKKAATLSAIGAFHQAVVISFCCKHCNCGRSVHVTYEFGPDGVRVTEGYPAGTRARAQEIYHVQPLLYSQVETIVNGMIWSFYLLLGRNCQDWARGFVTKLQRTAAEEVPPRPFTFVTVIFVELGFGYVEKFFHNNNLEMKFYDQVNVSQMVDKALEQSGLKAKGYKCQEVKQRKGLANSNRTEFVEADNGAPIEDGAFYKVLVHKPKVVVKQDIVEQGTDKVLRHNVEIELYGTMTVSQMAKEALKQSGLEAENKLTLVEMKQCNDLTGSIEYVRVDNDAAVENGAFYNLVVERKPKWQ